MRLFVQLPTHILLTCSLHLADWSDEQLAPLTEIGNVRSNEFYEAKLPAGTTAALADSYVVFKASSQCRVSLTVPAQNNRLLYPGEICRQALGIRVTALERSRLALIRPATICSAYLSYPRPAA